MGLKLTLGTGEKIVVPFDASSSLTVTYVTTVDGVQVEKAEAHADVVAVEFVDDPEPAQPEIVQLTGAEAAASQDVQVPISAEPPVQEPATADTSAPSTTDTTTTAPDESFLQKVQDKLGLGHDAVVSEAHAAVDAAASGAPADHVQAALADVDAALAAYPDSTQLQDAKAQLELQLGTQGA